jgi:hypothetical protein
MVVDEYEDHERYIKAKYLIDHGLDPIEIGVNRIKRYYIDD